MCCNKIIFISNAYYKNLIILYCLFYTLKYILFLIFTGNAYLLYNLNTFFTLPFFKYTPIIKPFSILCNNNDT